MTIATPSVTANLDELFSRVTALETLAREHLPAHVANRISASPVVEAGTYTSSADVANALADLQGRVATLEALAHDHLGTPLPTRPVETVSVPETPEVTTPAPIPAPVEFRPANVDYAAVAYGLTDLKAKLRDGLTISDHELNAQYQGVVEWFVGCFAGDPSFDADTFRRNAA
jgi:hypothetical protein